MSTLQHYRIHLSESKVSSTSPVTQDLNASVKILVIRLVKEDPVGLTLWMHWEEFSGLLAYPARHLHTNSTPAKGIDTMSHLHRVPPTR